MRIVLLCSLLLLSCGGKQDTVRMYNGLDGLDGLDGLRGYPGAPGEIGVPGASGADGTDGATGAVGLEGPGGTDGMQGPTGPEGKTGTMKKHTVCIYRHKYGWATVHVTVETFVFYYMWTRLKYYPGVCK